MKKIILIATFFLLILTGFGIYFFNHSDLSYLAIIKGTITSTQSKDSLATFHTSTKNTVTIFSDSIIEEGSLAITLLDSSGTVIQDFDTNKTSVTEVTLKKNKDYKLLVSYKGFIGSYEVKCK